MGELILLCASVEGLGLSGVKSLIAPKHRSGVGAKPTATPPPMGFGGGERERGSWKELVAAAFPGEIWVFRGKETKQSVARAQKRAANNATTVINEEAITVESPVYSLRSRTVIALLEYSSSPPPAGYSGKSMVMTAA